MCPSCECRKGLMQLLDSGHLLTCCWRGQSNGCVVTSCPRCSGRYCAVEKFLKVLSVSQPTLTPTIAAFCTWFLGDHAWRSGVVRKLFETRHLITPTSSRLFVQCQYRHLHGNFEVPVNGIQRKVDAREMRVIISSGASQVIHFWASCFPTGERNETLLCSTVRKPLVPI